MCNWIPFFYADVISYPWLKHNVSRLICVGKSGSRFPMGSGDVITMNTALPGTMGRCRSATGSILDNFNLRQKQVVFKEVVLNIFNDVLSMTMAWQIHGPYLLCATRSTRSDKFLRAGIWTVATIFLIMLYLHIKTCEPSFCWRTTSLFCRRKWSREHWISHKAEPLRCVCCSLLVAAYILVVVRSCIALGSKGMMMFENHPYANGGKDNWVSKSIEKDEMNMLHFRFF